MCHQFGDQCINNQPAITMKWYSSFTFELQQLLSNYRHLGFVAVTLSSVLIFACSATRPLPRELADTYYGFYPCADCPGIKYTLELTSKEFRRTMDYVERDFTAVDEGVVEYADGRIYLYENGNLTDRYEVEGDRLIHLDGEGNRITGNLAPFFVLYRGDPSKSEIPQEWGTLPQTARYKGTGNEPFWMVQVKESTLYFTGLMHEELEFEIPISDTRQSDDGKTITYEGQGDGNELVVQITHETCQDNMSGFYFPTALEVTLSLPEMDAQTLYGCGRYLGQDQLNGDWMLYAIDDEETENSGQTLSISLEENRISGNAGCNRFFGSIKEISDTEIAFHNIGSTKMACPDMNPEQHYLRFLDQTDITWHVDENDQLILQSKHGKRTFRRM